MGVGGAVYIAENRDVTTTARTVVRARDRTAGRDIAIILPVLLAAPTEAVTSQRGLLVDMEARTMRRLCRVLVCEVGWTRVATKAPTTVIPEAVRIPRVRLRASI